MVVFEDLVPSAQRMKNSFVYTLWSWAKVLSDFQGSALNVFFSLLGAVLGLV